MRRRIIKISLLFAFILSVNSVFSQKIDSVKLLLKTAKEDTVKINMLFWLVENLPDDNEWPKYNSIAYDLAEKLSKSSDPKIKLFAKRSLGSALNNLGYLFSMKGDYSKAMGYHERSLRISEELGNKSGMAGSYNNIGFICLNQGHALKALDYFGRALGIQEELGDKKEKARLLNNIGSVYNNYGDVSKAIGFYQKSYKISEEIGDKAGVANSLNSIGFVCSNQGDNEKAKEYYMRSIKIKEEIGDKHGLGSSYTNIGLVFSKQNDPKKALSYFEKGLKIREELEDKSGIANSMVNIGSLYHGSKDYEKALFYFEKSLKINLEINSKSGIAESYIDLGSLYHDMKNFKQALYCSERSLDLAKELGFPEMIRNAERILAKTDSASGNYKGAFGHYKQFIFYRDSIKNEATRKANLKSQFQMEFDKKERDVNLKAEAEKQLVVQKNSDEQKQKNIVIYSVLFGLLLVIVFSGFLVKSLNKNKKANIIITQQKLEVEQSKKEIIDSINYAKRIQYALLASDNLLSTNLPEHFVLFKPKDVVSGDFYWATPTSSGFIYITADCTGHGVPGAFMSLLNISKLSQAINENKIVKPDLILNNVRSEISKALNPEGTTEESKDGMDAILCKLDVKRMKLEYAAANNSFFIIRDNKVIVCNADKMPVGKGHDDSMMFTYNEIDLRKGDTIYTFTDGFADQFGGANGKKFKRKQLEEVLVNIHMESMQTQKEILLQKFNDWKGGLEQVDDMLLIGVRIS